EIVAVNPAGRRARSAAAGRAHRDGARLRIDAQHVADAGAGGAAAVRARRLKDLSLLEEDARGRLVQGDDAGRDAGRRLDTADGAGPRAIEGLSLSPHEIVDRTVDTEACSVLESPLVVPGRFLRGAVDRRERIVADDRHHELREEVWRLVRL